jgi:hypothetical protein
VIRKFLNLIEDREAPASAADCREEWAGAIDEL